jgi:PadR family transcriptional regulator PadR
MSSADKKTHQVLHGRLDLIVLRYLTIRPQHGYQIATRLQQISDGLLNLNLGTLYPALVGLEQYGSITGSWSKPESGREANFYAITVAGQKTLRAEMDHWRRTSQLIERLLVEGTGA